MRFLAPHFLHLAWLALIPLALYLFKKKARRLPVSTLLFFRSLAREHQESAWLRRLKRWLSLLLTLLVLLLAVFALARPVADTGLDTPPAVVLVVDVSAAMAARDAAGRSRLDVARDLARARLRVLPDQAVLSLVVADGGAQVPLSRSRNRRECLRLLDALRPLPVPPNPEAALTAARRLAELEEGARIWHFSDRPLEAVGDLALEFVPAALEAPLNVGITAFQLRPAPLAHDRHEAFVKVQAAQANVRPLAATLEVRVAGRLAQLRELELAPGAEAALVLPLEGVRGQRLEIQLRAEGDCLGWDNAVAAILPKTRPLVVARVAATPDPFVELALASLVEAGRIELLKVAPTAWPLADKPDVYVFDQWLPPDWPADRPALLLDPPAATKPLPLRRLAGAGLPHAGVRAAAPDHPVLFRVAAGRVALTQTAVLELGGTLEPLWMTGGEPVLAAGERDGQRLVVAAFSPARSEQLALLPAFPLLLGNALYWCAEGSAALAGVATQRPGDLVEEEGLRRWLEWDGSRFTETTEVLEGGVTRLSRLGAWEAADGRTGVSALVSAAVTDLPARGAAETAEASPPVASGWAAAGLPQLLIWAVLAVLLLESWLFHRKAVY